MDTGDGSFRIEVWDWDEKPHLRRLDVSLGALGECTCYGPGARLLTSCRVKGGRFIRHYGKGGLSSSVERAVFCTRCDTGGPYDSKYTNYLATRSIAKWMA